MEIKIVFMNDIINYYRTFKNKQDLEKEAKNKGNGNWASKFFGVFIS